MTGGSISGNTAGRSSGGGVYVNGTFNMSGGSISGNTASNSGSGVYMNGTFTMAGGAVVAQEVYLASGKTIVVSGSLTPPTGKYSAIITMASYPDNTPVLAGTDEHQLDNNDISKFKLDADSSKTIIISGSTGVIANTSVGVTDGGQTEYYASLAEAIAAATTGTEVNPVAISLMRSIEVNASITVDNGKHIKIIPGGDTVTVTINRGFTTGSLFTVGGGASLTLTGSDTAQLVLDGGSEDELNDAAPLITVNNGGKLTMNNGAVLQNNNTEVHGGAVYVQSGTFTMYGGEIIHNTAAGGSGGGVYVASGSTFTMAGGTISGNEAASLGSGVYVANGGSFTMGNGTISGNKARDGGGVHVDGTFTMNGGTISGNTAGTGGGGVYVGNGGTFNMSDGTISGNTTIGDGGGVYLYNTSASTFTKTGGTIYGADAGADSNTVGSGKTGAALYKGASATSEWPTSETTF
jgi:hypothetical protein